MKKIFLFLTVLLACINAYSAAGYSFTEAPENNQLYPRNSSNKATVTFKGDIYYNKYATGKIEIYRKDKGDVGYSKISTLTVFNNFNSTYEIDAGLHEYKFMIKFTNKLSIPIHETIASSVVCGDVYVITGQSNALATIYEEAPQFDLDYTSPYSKSYGICGYYATSSDTWGRSTSNATKYSNDANKHFVGAWGLYLQYKIAEEYGMPTCVINGAVGGTSIDLHLKGNNVLYEYLYSRLSGAKLLNSVKAVLWYQGESDASAELPQNRTCTLYDEKFSKLYKSWEEDYHSPMIYAVQIHTNWDTGGIYIREKQRQFLSLYKKIRVTSSLNMKPWQYYNPSKDKMHFNSDNYKMLGEELGDMIGYDFYNTGVLNLPPNIIKAYYSGNTLKLQFDQYLSDEDLNDIKNEFYFNETVAINGISVSGKTLSLNLSNSNSTTVGYVGEWGSNYKYLKGTNGMAAYSFYNITIGADPAIGSVPYSNTKHWRHFIPCYSMPANVSSDIVMSADGKIVFYKTLDGDINAIYFNGTAWIHSDLNDCIQNGEVAGDLTISSSNTVFYRTKNNAIRCIYYNNSDNRWYWSALNDCAPAQTVGGDLAADSQGRVFYRTINNGINMIYYSNGRWLRSNLNNCVQNNKVAGDLVTSSNKCFYRTTDNTINCVYLYYGIWNWSGLNDCTPNRKVKGELKVNSLGKVFYQTTDNTINCIYWNNNKWNWSGLNDQTCANVNNICIDNNNEVYYTTSDSYQINSIFYNSQTSSWEKSFLENNVPNNAAGAIASKNNKTVFYKGGDNKIHAIKYDYLYNSLKSDNNETVSAESLENDTMNDYKIFPNPVSEVVTITFDDQQLDTNGMLEIEIIGLSGKALITERVNYSSSGQYTLDMGSIPSGIYVLKLNCNGQNLDSKQIMKQ